MASIHEFIDFINTKIERPLIIIPAYSFDILPNYPFVTWEETGEPDIETMFKLDGVVNDDIERIQTDYAEFYQMSNITLKVYSNNKQEAFDKATELLQLIKFKERYSIVREGYGVINVDKNGEFPEKLETGEYLQCYSLNCKIDFSNTIERNTPYLDEIDVTVQDELNVNIDLT